MQEVWLATHLNSRKSQQHRLRSERQSIAKLRIVMGLVVISPVSCEVTQAINGHLAHAASSDHRTNLCTWQSEQGRDIVQLTGEV